MHGKEDKVDALLDIEGVLTMLCLIRLKLYIFYISTLTHHNRIITVMDFGCI